MFRSRETNLRREGARAAADPGSFNILGVRAKEAVSAELLSLLVGRRLRWLPAVRQELTHDPALLLSLGPVISHPMDDDGRNWDVLDFRCGGVNAGSCPERFRGVVNLLRDEFDLALA